MENEYGAVLDRHGYAPSILQSADCCFKCGRTDGKIDRHEVFHADMGGKMRDRSKRYGLWVRLCRYCHEDAHKGEYAERLKRYAQGCAMEEYGWSTETFVRLFGKNYR